MVASLTPLAHGSRLQQLQRWKVSDSACPTSSFVRSFVRSFVGGCPHIVAMSRRGEDEDESVRRRGRRMVSLVVVVVVADLFLFEGARGVRRRWPAVGSEADVAHAQKNSLTAKILGVAITTKTPNGPQRKEMNVLVKAL